MDLIKCFKALSDNTRLRLLFVLQKYELNVNEIVTVVEMIQSGVSRHLKILVDSGLLISRRQGSFIYYSAVEDRHFTPVFNFINRELESDNSFVKDLDKAAEMITIRHDRTKRFFKTVAPQWDRLKREVLGDFNLNAQIERLLSESGRISDLGCGTGELLQFLSDKNKKTLIGIDSSPEMLEQARVRLSGVPETQLRLGEIEHLPMKNREIDTAVMSMVLHHIPQPRQSIREVYRVIQPGGSFIMADFEKHNNKQIQDIIGGEWLGFEKEVIAGWLTDEGFNDIKIESFEVNHGLIINVFIAKKPHAKEQA